MVEQVSFEDLSLDFTVPGYDIELRVCFQTCVTNTRLSLSSSPEVETFQSLQKMLGNIFAKSSTQLLGKARSFKLKPFARASRRSSQSRTCKLFLLMN